MLNQHRREPDQPTQDMYVAQYKAISNMVDNRLAQLLEALHSVFNLFPVDTNILFDEYNYASSGNTISLVPNIAFPVLVQSIIASIPTGTTGILTIGAASRLRQFNIAPGQAPLNNIAIIVYPNDVFTLTTTGSAGLVGLEVMGLGLKNTGWRVL